MRVLVGVDVLTVDVEVTQLFRVSVVAGESFLDRARLVARVDLQPLLYLGGRRRVIEEVVAFPGHGVGRSQGEALDYRVVGDVQAEDPARNVCCSVK